jgi:hypothetical protein
MIDLGKHDDPAAVIAMIGYCYHGTYPERGDLPAEHHLTMYRLADFYDIPDLRTKTSWQVLASLSPANNPDVLMTSEAIRSIRKIVGPDVECFADNSIQEEVFKLVVSNIKHLYKNNLFKTLLAEGIMFDKRFAKDFVDKVDQLISDLDKRCSASPSRERAKLPLRNPGHNTVAAS